METLVYGEPANGVQAVYCNSIEFKRSVDIYYSTLFGKSMHFMYFLMVMNKVSLLVGKYENILLVAGRHLGVVCVCPPCILCVRWRRMRCERMRWEVTRGHGR